MLTEWRSVGEQDVNTSWNVVPLVEQGLSPRQIEGPVVDSGLPAKSKRHKDIEESLSEYLCEFWSFLIRKECMRSPLVNPSAGSATNSRTSIAWMQRECVLKICDHLVSRRVSVY